VTSGPTTPAELETVTLTEEEVVLTRGAGIVTWLVSHNDGWVRAGSHPRASSEMLDRGSGVVWRTRIKLELARGTELQRIEIRPDVRPRSALEHLEAGSRGAPRAKKIRRYQVGPRGELVPLTPPAKMT
jgi:hypothetical protein